MSRIAILGSGAWGTALALSLSRNPNHQVTLWSPREESAAALQSERENRRFLPGFPFPDPLAVTCDDELAVAKAETLVCAVPSEFLRDTVVRLLPHMNSGQIVVSATKGIVQGIGLDVMEGEAANTYLRISQVIGAALAQVGLDSPVGALSGPSFAQEVAAGKPTALTIAFPESLQPNAATQIQQEFSSPSLRLYTHDDVVGVELGGALKNVIAIASGIVAGLDLGANSAAALITRGIAEMTRLAVAAGGRRETLSGLSGIGDLVLTCTGALSRNRTVGFELGRGRSLSEILAALNGKVAEGIRTTTAALGLARSLGVEMPITEQMELILLQDKSPREAIKDLMQRPNRDEED